MTFQAPGVGDEAAKVDPKKHSSTHYMASGDLVSRAGGQPTEGDVVRMAAWGSNGPLNRCWYPLASLNEHRKEDAIKEGPHRNNAFVPGVSASIGKHNLGRRSDPDRPRLTRAPTTSIRSDHLHFP